MRILSSSVRLALEQLERRTLLSVAGSTFESQDGNLVHVGSGIDWDNAPNLQIALDKPTGQTDDSLGQGSKEDSAVPNVVNGSIPNNKSDLTRFYVANETVAINNKANVFVYLAWERANTLGTANIDFEFNQLSTISANGKTPVRTVGDVLITFDFASGGGKVELGLRKWLGSAWGPATDLDAGGFAEGSVNDGFSVSDPVPPNAPRTLADKTFGEAAINLTAAGVLPPDQCVHFGRAFVKSRSSTSFTAELKDFIAPIPINITNCSSINGTKFNDLNGDGDRDFGEPGLEGWTINLDTNADGTVDATTTTDSAGMYSFHDLLAGTYRVREVQQNGWTQTTANPADITLGVQGGAVDGVDFGNFRLINLSGAKFSDLNNNGQRDAGEPGLANWTINLDKGADGSVDATTTTDSSGNYSFSSLGPGVYRLREIQQSGWTQTTTNPADVTASSGHNVTGLDFGNFQLQPDVRISKAQKMNGQGITQVDHGQTFTYLLTVVNDGVGPANGVVVTDTVDDGLVVTAVSYVIDSQQPVNVPVNGNSLSISIGTLASSDGQAGGNDTAVVTVTVRAEADCGVIPNTAHVSATNEPAANQGDDDSNTVNIIVFPTLPNDGIVIGRPFESTDGNLVENNASKTDWSTFIGTPNLLVSTDLSTGQSDDSFGQGTKEDTAVPSVVDGSIPNNKSDLLRFYLSSDKVNGDNYLYLGWVRANTLGTANMDFEFNQSSTLSANGVTPVRTAGDMLITFDFSQGGNTVALGLRRWLSTGKWGPVINLNSAGIASGSVNDPAFGQTGVLDPIANKTLAQGTFGEAAINVTAVFAGTIAPGECVHFASAYLKSRSSDSFTSAVKDFIAPIEVGLIVFNPPALPRSAPADALSTSAGATSTTTTTFNTSRSIGEEVLGSDDTLVALLN